MDLLKLLITHNIRNQTMTGDIRYVGDDLGNGILEWKSLSVINTVADLTAFFSATPSLLESASAGTEWNRGANDTWTQV